MAVAHVPGTSFVDRRGALSVIHLRGEHDLTTASDLRERLDHEIDAGASGVVVSLACVEPGSFAERLFGAIDLDPLVSVADSMPAALAAAARPTSASRRAELG